MGLAAEFNAMLREATERYLVERNQEFCERMNDIPYPEEVKERSLESQLRREQADKGRVYGHFC